MVRAMNGIQETPMMAAFSLVMEVSL
ncbi:hypothetical protein BDFB_010782 [Asbolus verrucosus]|uniref:Uncharacterized protein n=1 Tax=Asbolus verrucosus TaxID=1661398 RepID=A0A482W1N4_ASBVE|nr:hypothetical protein BDFB_010782 [Asbolus verrucosus]